MAKLIATIKAILTRLVFGAHGFVAIWQVTQFKKNPFYWYLCTPMLLLFFEGIFTLTIKETQEWKWFCPSVFLYLTSVVPAIWLLELDKVDKRLRMREETLNISANADLNELHRLLGVQIKLPELQLSAETWVTLIEQFLMLTLIIGRWMLPKGELTRDQLSQLLLVYIGTAADIIEFFDSFKDEKIASEPLLVILTLSIWSWSLMQFTVVLTATKSRKSRLSTNRTTVKSAQCCCCNIDVWGIALNILLQDAPFLAFRLLIILHFNIISYMNVFFTCKNTLVILLQLYRLYVVYSENHKIDKKPKIQRSHIELSNIAVISKMNYDSPTLKKSRHNRTSCKKAAISDKGVNIKRINRNASFEDFERSQIHKNRKISELKNTRKDTGYSTASSQTSYTQTPLSLISLGRESSSDYNKKSKTERLHSRNSSREQVCSKKHNKLIPHDDDMFSEESEHSILENVTFSESDSPEEIFKRKYSKKYGNRHNREVINNGSSKQSHGIINTNIRSMRNMTSSDVSDASE